MTMSGTGMDFTRMRTRTSGVSKNLSYQINKCKLVPIDPLWTPEYNSWVPGFGAIG